MKEGQYFQTTRRGELRELRDSLNSPDKTIQKDAVKKAIMATATGNMSALFPDVIKYMATTDIELKKLVYVYLQKYAQIQPDKALLCSGMLMKDMKQHPNPLVRGVAVRTMSEIRHARTLEYFVYHIASLMADRDPYVRKTAALTVAKLYDMNGEMVESSGAIEKLRTLLDDPDRMVVANAAAALCEISQLAGEDYLRINTHRMWKLLGTIDMSPRATLLELKLRRLGMPRRDAMVWLPDSVASNDGWGHVFILDLFANFKPEPGLDLVLCEWFLPQLRHKNPAVVMAAVRAIIAMLSTITDQDFKTRIITRLSAPLVALLSGPPEIQYVVLRNINLIIQKYPIMQSRVRVFFCKHNDAVYVKLEKLKLIVRLVSADNIGDVLLELKRYAQGLDVEFARKTVRAIGRCAIKLDGSVPQCISVLMELVASKTGYIIQEAIVVVRDIFRRYPTNYDRVITNMCHHEEVTLQEAIASWRLESLSEPEAKAAMIWIVGEYGERLSDAAQRLGFFARSFRQEHPSVQLTLLTACAKLFLKKPEQDEVRTLITKVLNLATEDSDNPDIRDRGYIYWRLLSTDTFFARAVVLAEKPAILCGASCVPSLDALLTHISTAASVYYKPPSTFVKAYTSARFNPHIGDSDDGRSSVESESDTDEGVQTRLVLEWSCERCTYTNEYAAPRCEMCEALHPVDDAFKLQAIKLQQLNITNSTLLDAKLRHLGMPRHDAARWLYDPKLQKLKITKGNPRGLSLEASMTWVGTLMTMKLKITNPSKQHISQIKIRFNKNVLGIQPRELGALSVNVPTGCSSITDIPCVITPTARYSSQHPPPSQASDRWDLQIALALQPHEAFGVIYATCACSAFKPACQWYYTFAKTTETLSAEQFIGSWQNIGDAGEKAGNHEDPSWSLTLGQILLRLNAMNINHIHTRNARSKNICYAYCWAKMNYVGSQCQLIEVAIRPILNPRQLRVTVRSTNEAERNFTQELVLRMMS